MAPRKKPLVQPAASSSALSLALHEADDGKRVGSVTDPDNSSASEAAREQRTGIQFIVAHTEQDHVTRSRGGTLIVLGEEDR